jgi:hypothetical protein
LIKFYPNQIKILTVSLLIRNFILIFSSELIFLLSETDLKK